VAAPYLHPRLTAIEVASSNRNGNGGGGDINIVQIFAVPRGSVVDAKTGTITTSDGEAVTDLPSVEPFVGTPPLELSAPTDQTPAPLEPIAEQPIVVIEMEPAPNVTRLDTFKAKRDEPGTA
jgi:hypothetical protein